MKNVHRISTKHQWGMKSGVWRTKTQPSHNQWWKTFTPSWWKV